MTTMKDQNHVIVKEDLHHHLRTEREEEDNVVVPDLIHHVNVSIS